MMFRRWMLVVLVMFVSTVSLSAVPVRAQEGMGKGPLTHDDYDAWKRIQGQQISPNGEWVVYSAVPQDGDGELIATHVESGREHRYPRGAGARFMPDSTYIVFTIAPSEAETEEARKAKTKPEDMPKSSLGIMNLAGGEVIEIERVRSFRVPQDAGGHIAYLHEESEEEEPPSAVTEEQEEGEEAEADESDNKDKDFGTTLTVHSLADGSEWNAESVLSYQFTDTGAMVLYTVSSEETPESDGVYMYSPAQDAVATVLSGEGNYERLALDEDQDRLAFVTDRDDYSADEPTFNLYGWDFGSPMAELWVSHTSTENFPAGMAVSRLSQVSFNEDGSTVLLGVKEIPEPKPDNADEGEDEEKAVFDLWSWDDPYPQPQQEQMRNRVENQTWASVYHVGSGRFVKLADKDIPDVRLSNDGSVAFASTNVPYTKRVSYYGSFSDAYVIDPMTGNRTMVAEGLFRGASLSPGGQYVSWFGMDDYDWHVYDIANETTRNLTETLDVRFDREDWDQPQAAGSYGIAGWLSGDEGVLVYDRYDIWMLRPDGSEARMITDGYGRTHDLSFRRIRLNPDEDFIDPAAELLLGTTNEETRSTGFYVDSVSGNELPREVIMADKSIGNPTKARAADVVMYTQSTFAEYPDIWVSGMDFIGKKVSNLGAQTDSFLWGEAELRNFRSSDGVPLKGILIKPENFDPDRKYPLLVYIYETLHQGLHSFRHPSPGTSVNASYYVSNDYVMWMPDIEYGTGYPGKDALKCVLPSINMLVTEGFIDEDRIGIQGHSWGGYQISYMVTQTNIFAAAEAGAPVSNMTSAYGGIRWASGMVRQFQYEQTQSRLGDSLWEVPLRYVENSPIFWADKIETPLLILHNDEDGAVPWYQGIEFIMALRRLEKRAWMFNYNGEAHGLRQRVNQKDFTVRMQEFFDYYLKDQTPPLWM
ncbi:MAG TPA: prolyl oligopeptidase family serine peptidase, partial [Acidobacteriota bacterium]|nr:prolyl oligopeptidase family serine peptidase [Acidobacteriota bacterium]